MLAVPWMPTWVRWAVVGRQGNPGFLASLPTAECRRQELNI